MKNKWKISFWVCFILLVATGLFGFYSIIDQGVTITYMKEGYSDTEADLETITSIISQTNQTKLEVEKLLKTHRLYEYMDFSSDTVGLERVILIFDNDSLKSIEKQW